MTPNNRPLTKTEAALVACWLTIFWASSAMAQGAGADIIGATAIKDDAIVIFKVIGALGIAWGFMRLMSGRHTVEGLVTMGVGALGIAKTDAIAALMGL